MERAAPPSGTPGAPGALFAALAAEPWAHDFFLTLRRIDAWERAHPPLGKALRPRAEGVRLGQDVELDMAPSTLSSFTPHAARPPRLGQRFFGLFGPMGPLPLHLSEHVRERERHYKDAAPARFADIFHHRALLLYYRAWADAQPAVHLDRAGADAWSRWLGSLIGNIRTGGPRAEATLFHAGVLAGGTRHAEGLAKILRAQLGVAVRVQPHVGRWLPLRDEDRTRLLPAGAARPRHALGAGAVAGNRVWDRQAGCRIALGPLARGDYERFLPGTAALDELDAWVRRYLGLALDWHACAGLRGAEVPRLRLPAREPRRGGRLVPQPGRQGCLGWTTWLGRVHERPHPDRHDLRLRPGREGPAAHARMRMTLVDGRAAAQALS